MRDALLIQLPVPQNNFGHQTANIPFGAACLKQTADHIPGIRIDIMPESIASYLGDAALLNIILDRKPDVLGFSTFAWNIKRVLFLSKKIKEQYKPQIVLGGPEITRDNPLIKDAAIDCCIFGAGESAFTELMTNPQLVIAKPDPMKAFRTQKSPYLTIELEPQIGNMMLVETTRGCPYSCAYCYYGKSLKKPVFKEDSSIVEAIALAFETGIGEVYLLDPSLNARPGLKSLLKRIAVLNRDKKLRLISEIRAEAIDGQTARLMAEAGFAWLEIGLQSTNPKALELMRRHTDLDKFLAGIGHLKKAGIKPGIDLIMGLPGDDPDGFRKSIDFIKRHNLQEDIQIFPLSILPGTQFRRNHLSLGLVFDPNPPYTVRHTATFSEQDFITALTYAEKQLDTSFYPQPDLNLAWRKDDHTDINKARDKTIVIDEQVFIQQVYVHPGRGCAALQEVSTRVTHPYQILIPPAQQDHKAVRQALSLLTRANPFTPLEIVFFEPQRRPDTDKLLQTAKIDRPHYLDGDLRFLYDEPGNRTLLLTVVTQKPRLVLSGQMQRNVFWSRQHRLPDEDELNHFEELGFDGILIDTTQQTKSQESWQDRFAPLADELLFICFAQFGLQQRWLRKTAPEDYYFDIISR